jgi:hypothetical protein
MKFICVFIFLWLPIFLYANSNTIKEKSDTHKPSAQIEKMHHSTLKERLDIGPELRKGTTYKVYSMYVDLYDALCSPITHRGGQILCDNTETLIKEVDIQLSTQEAKTKFYRSKKNGTDGCFTFTWTNYGKIKIIDFEDGGCK